MTTLHVAPHASHFQFRVEDSVVCDCCDVADAWADLPTGRRLATAVHVIAVGTARYAVVPVAVHLVEGAPELDFSRYHHVEEADLLLPSGVMHLDDGVASDSPTRIPLAPGRYRIRVGYTPATEPSDGQGEHLEYQLWVWPIPLAADPAVIKQGPEVWAG